MQFQNDAVLKWCSCKTMQFQYYAISICNIWYVAIFICCSLKLCIFENDLISKIMPFWKICNFKNDAIWKVMPPWKICNLKNGEIFKNDVKLYNFKILSKKKCIIKWVQPKMNLENDAFWNGAVRSKSDFWNV